MSPLTDMHDRVLLPCPEKCLPSQNVITHVLSTVCYFSSGQQPRHMRFKISLKKHAILSIHFDDILIGLCL